MAPIHLSGVRVVVLDLDDTLYPERAFAFSGFEAVGRWLQTQMECPFDPVARMRQLFETEHRSRIFNQLLAEVGLEPAGPLVETMIERYRRHEPRIHLFEDADEALQRWSGRFKIGLISDGPADIQRRKVAALHLDTRIERIILTDLWGREFWKPHPRAFEEIEKKWGWRESACLYLADNPAKDFVCPRQRGWQTVQIRRPEGVHINNPAPPGGEPAWTVASLAQVRLSS